MIFNQLKGHAIVEDNNLNGIRQSHMIAWAPFDPAGHTDPFLDNGMILKLNSELKLVVADNLEGDLYLHYSEEHMTFLDSASLDMFTVTYDENNVAYPRAIALLQGDVYTTNCATGIEGTKFDKFYQLSVTAGKLVVGAEVTPEYNGPVAKRSALPAGQPAIEIVWRGGK